MQINDNVLTIPAKFFVELLLSEISADADNVAHLTSWDYFLLKLHALRTNALLVQTSIEEFCEVKEQLLVYSSEPVKGKQYFLIDIKADGGNFFDEYAD